MLVSSAVDSYRGFIVHRCVGSSMVSMLVIDGVMLVTQIVDRGFIDGVMVRPFVIDAVDRGFIDGVMVSMLVIDGVP